MRSSKPKSMLRSSSSRIYLLPFFLLLIHSAEEFVTGFPEWATRYFGTTTAEFYVLSHIVLLLLVGLACLLAFRTKRTLWQFIALAIQVELTINALFHIVTTFIFHQFSPGLISSLLVVGGSILFFQNVLREKPLTPKFTAGACGVGITTAALVIASLWLDF